MYSSGHGLPHQTRVHPKDTHENTPRVHFRWHLQYTPKSTPETTLSWSQKVYFGCIIWVSLRCTRNPPLTIHPKSTCNWNLRVCIMGAPITHLLQHTPNPPGIASLGVVVGLIIFIVHNSTPATSLVIHSMQQI